VIANPIFNAFSVIIPRNFFYQEVLDRFKPLYNGGLPYENLVDYVNASIINAKIPGFSDDGSTEQTYSNAKSRTNSGVIPLEGSETKELEITFKHYSSFLNYFLLREQMLVHVQKRRINRKSYLPNIQLAILNEFGSVVLWLDFSDIRFKSIDEILFSKQDNTIAAKEFSVVFAYNDYKMKFNLELQNSRSDSLHNYDLYSY